MKNMDPPSPYAHSIGPNGTRVLAEELKVNTTLRFLSYVTVFSLSLSFYLPLPDRQFPVS